jgi:hypothetical protein
VVNQAFEKAYPKVKVDSEYIAAGDTTPATPTPWPPSACLPSPHGQLTVTVQVVE